jgi:pyruvate/2-oxoglutarate dehydrogenase complex dihydrolipoamide acyltransferase (E2) component
MKKYGQYRLEDFPESRIGTVDIGIASHMKHHIRALIELDVTEARKRIAEQKKNGVRITFNAWLIKCISMTIAEFPELHGVRKGRNKIVLFEDIDISIMVERETGGVKIPLPYVIRKSNEKSVLEISDEIRKAQSQIIENEEDHVLGEEKHSYSMKLYYAMPGFIRKQVWKHLIRSPFLTKNNMGTVMITSVGMIGRIKGWVIPVSVHPIAFAVGAIVKKPGVTDDRIEIRESLYVTVAVDHDVIDGAPAVRALSRLTTLVEKAAGL